MDDLAIPMGRVVLDMDPGIDDAIALSLALNSPELELIAVTTVSGNVNVRKGTLNALRIVEALSKQVPVCMGASHPLSRGKTIRAESIHGGDGLGNSGLGRPTRNAEKITAVEMLTELLNSSKKREVSIVATGPLTNIAMLMQREPSLARKLDRIFVMGGLYDPMVRGNVTEYAEFNFFTDPESADIVMITSGSRSPEIVAVGLELTSHPACAVSSKTLEMICSIGSMSSELACRILRWPVLTHSYFNLHDVFAIFALIHPEIFVFKRCSVRVAHSGSFRGRCTITSGKGNVQVCKKVNPSKFNQLVLDGLK